MTPLTTYNRWVRIYSRPGKVEALEPATAYNQHAGLEKGSAYVYLKNGQIKNVKLTVKGGFGPLHIWVEDDGYVPPTAKGAAPECANGIDDDGDGFVDMNDPGCLMANDRSEAEGTSIASNSETIYFKTPTISDVQGRGKASPFIHEEVEINRGQMVVTRIAPGGFYVTDIADKDGYNSIYVYSYHTPPFLRVCDRITDLWGNVGEFYGFTELNFPTWSFEPWNEKRGPCAVPDPVVITPQMLKDRDKMESLEASLVRIENIVTGDTPVNCDYNGDGEVNYCSGNPDDPECKCRTRCEKDPFCTEYNNYRTYKQWAAVLNNGKGPRIWVISGQSVPDFDPFKNGGRIKVRAITGTLKEFKYLDPPWIIEVRCPDDLVVKGMPKRANESCIYSRTGAVNAPD